MIGKSSLVLVILALVAVPAAAIVVDGDISDWDAAWILDDPDDDNADHDFEIVRYGVHLMDGNLYAFVELNRPVSDFAASGARCHPGMWIDMDSTCQLDVHTVAELPGTDILIEYGYNAGEGSEGQDLNYWGLGDNVWGLVDGGIPGGTAAASGNILEFMAPFSGIISTAALFDDNPETSGFWQVMIAGEGNANDGNSDAWGRDFAALAVYVPEPSTCTLLLLGALGLLLRRRRR